MKIFNLILAGLFLIFAALQLNDDPGDILFWVAMYLLIAGISAFAAFQKYNMWVIMAGIAVTVYEMFCGFPAIAMWIDKGMPSIVGEMKASSPHIEKVREMLGLFICFVVLIFQYMQYTAWRKKWKDAD